MILTGPEIRRLIARTRRRKASGGAPKLPSLDVTPFNSGLCGPNSLDIHLGRELLRYDLRPRETCDAAGNTIIATYLDSRAANPTAAVPFPESGLIVHPGDFYLAVVSEHIECHGLVPCLETRSSIARLGISTHLSAGLGDDGAAMRWTLELTFALPVKIYPGMRIAQMVFHTIKGERQPYAGKYQGSLTTVSSLLWRDCHESK